MGKNTTKVNLLMPGSCLPHGGCRPHRDVLSEERALVVTRQLGLPPAARARGAAHGSRRGGWDPRPSWFCWVSYPMNPTPLLLLHFLVLYFPLVELCSLLFNIVFTQVSFFSSMHIFMAPLRIHYEAR